MHPASERATHFLSTSPDRRLSLAPLLYARSHILSRAEKRMANEIDAGQANGQVATAGHPNVRASDNSEDAKTLASTDAASPNGAKSAKPARKSLNRPSTALSRKGGRLGQTLR
jgi:hypothetical protein